MFQCNCFTKSLWGLLVNYSSSADETEREEEHEYCGSELYYVKLFPSKLETLEFVHGKGLVVVCFK